MKPTEAGLARPRLERRVASQTSASQAALPAPQWDWTLAIIQHGERLHPWLGFVDQQRIVLFEHFVFWHQGRVL